MATHAGTVASGYWEIESGGESDRIADGTRVLAIPTVLKFGVARTAQLSLFVPALRETGVPLGMGDLGAGVKWRLVDSDGPLQHFAILPTVKWPTGGDRGTRTTDVGLLLIDSRSIGPVNLDLNAGLTRRSGDGGSAPRTSTLWTVATGFPAYGPLGWQLECFGLPGTHGPSGAAPSVAVLTGPTLSAWRWLSMDAGVIIPLAGPQARAVYAGFVANLGRWH